MQIKKYINDLGYELIDKYLENSFQRAIIKDNNGYLYDCKVSELKKYNPDFVHKSNPYSLKNISLWIKLNNKNFELTHNNKYNGNNEKLELRCFECNDIFYMGWASIHSGQNCSVCRGMQAGLHHSICDTNPNLLDEWDYELNEINPKSVTFGSTKKNTLDL